MPRVEADARIALALFAGLAAGCASDLVSLDRHPDSRSTGPESWSSTGRDFQDYGLGIVAVEFGPKSQDQTHGRMTAAICTTMNSMDVRAEYLMGIQPRVTIWDAIGVELLSQELPHSSGCLRFTPDGKQCLFGADTGVLVWSVEDRTVQRKLISAEPPEAISKDCRLIAVKEHGDKRTTIRVLSIENGRQLATTEVHGIVSAQFVDGDHRLGLFARSIGATKNEISVWDFEADQCTAPFKPPGHRGAFSADGSRYAGKAVGNSVCVWDTDGGTELFTTGPHSSHVFTMAFSPHGRFIASAAEGQRRRGEEFGRSKSGTPTPAPRSRQSSTTRPGESRLWHSHRTERNSPPATGAAQ